MNGDTAIVLIILIVLTFVIISNFNKNIFDIYEKDLPAQSNYEYCIYDCQNRYTTMINKQKCIDNICKDFSR